MASSVPDVLPDRIEILLLARLSTYVKPPKEARLARSLYPYAPTTFGEAQWRDQVSRGLRDLQDRQLVTPALRPADSDELKRRIGPCAVKKWEPWADRILPGLGLGLRADDTRSHARLSRPNGWPAAIVGRALHLWEAGPPPSAAALCDALAWRELGLDGVPQPCPARIRTHFLRKHVADDPGTSDRLVRLLANQTVGSPSPALEVLRAALVRRWLLGRELGAPPPAPSPVEAVRTVAHASLVETVRTVAHAARDGVFGDRKVFISSVWNALRALAPWSGLALADFKAQLITAHRKQELVLARADLVAAMDPALVAASETWTDGASFHFIVREPVR